MKQIIVHPQERKHSLERMYGIFFEDISNAGDGGLYAEMVQNRAFEFCPMDGPDCDAMTAWEMVAEGKSKVSVSVQTKDPVNAKNPHHLVMDFESVDGKAGIRNTGFYTGIPIFAGEKYRLRFTARSSRSMSCYIALESKEGRIFYRKPVQIDSREWKSCEFQICAGQTDETARLFIGSETTGKLSLDFVSLFPCDTFCGHQNGLRNDLAKMIAELKPRFLRFPGGCAMHVGSLNEEDRNAMYRWKNTLGPVEERAAKSIRWRGHQTFGLGYYEFFQFCEDLGAEPVPVLAAGYDPHTGMGVPLDEMQPWIDDALDLIEFANGGPDTEWGAKRIALGHPEPFGLNDLAIGNEEEGAGFWDRYDRIHRAVRNAYPDIRLINTAGVYLDSEDAKRGWENARKNGSDLIDEHYYQHPEWLLTNIHRYDSYDRTGPKVMVGEVASLANTFFNALAEAAYLLELEKNADLVQMVCYAPLLCNVHKKQWIANLIYFDASHAFGTANYYVHKLLMNHCGTHSVNVECTGARGMVIELPEKLQHMNVRGVSYDAETVFVEPLYVNASWDEADSSVIIKAVKLTPAAEEWEIRIEGSDSWEGTLYEISGMDAGAENSFEEPDLVSPVEKPFSVKSGSFVHRFDREGIWMFRLRKKE